MSVAPTQFRVMRLGDVCELNPRRPEMSRSDLAPTTFVSMPAVATRGLGIVAPLIRPYAEVRKGYTYFADGDVLFAKITPCMQNGKHAIARGLIDGIGFGSTEFHVIRPRSEILPEWVLLYLVQPKILQEATAHFSGAVGQQRVPDEYLASLQIPVPPLDDQRRIAARLQEQFERIEKARSAATAQLQAAKALPSTYLRKVFESSEAQKWPDYNLAQLLSEPVRTGISKRGSPSADKLCLTLSSVRTGSFDLTEVKAADVTDSEAVGCWVKPRAFYVVRGNGNRALVGRGALAPESVPRVLFPDLLIQVITDPVKLLPRFLRLVWDSPRIRSEIESCARTSAGIFKINQANLGAIRIPCPLVDVQQKVIEKVEQEIARTYQLQTLIASEALAIESLMPVYLRFAFNMGECSG
ncbi:MAG: restriction endonuclease subunit S [Bryobacteraceae bacterium]